jgi:hypothetical protein
MVLFQAKIDINAALLAPIKRTGRDNQGELDPWRDNSTGPDVTNSVEVNGLKTERHECTEETRL